MNDDYHGWLKGWLWRRLGCAETVADLAQDTFVRLLGKPVGRYRRGWLQWDPAVADLRVSMSSASKTPILPCRPWRIRCR